MHGGPGPWGDRLLGFAITVLVSGVLLRVAWSEVRPLLPVLIVGCVVYGYFKWLRRG